MEFLLLLFSYVEAIPSPVYIQSDDLELQPLEEYEDTDALVANMRDGNEELQPDERKA